MLDYCWSLYCVGQKKTGINWLASKALSELGTALPQLVIIIIITTGFSIKIVFLITHFSAKQ